MTTHKIGLAVNDAKANGGASRVDKRTDKRMANGTKLDATWTKVFPPTFSID